MLTLETTAEIKYTAEERTGDAKTIVEKAELPTTPRVGQLPR